MPTCHPLTAPLSLLHRSGQPCGTMLSFLYGVLVLVVLDVLVLVEEVENVELVVVDVLV